MITPALDYHLHFRGGLFFKAHCCFWVFSALIMKISPVLPGTQGDDKSTAREDGLKDIDT
jgi:hypothetical protein